MFLCNEFGPYVSVHPWKSRMAPSQQFEYTAHYYNNAQCIAAMQFHKASNYVAQEAKLRRLIVG